MKLELIDAPDLNHRSGGLPLKDVSDIEVLGAFAVLSAAFHVLIGHGMIPVGWWVRLRSAGPSISPMSVACRKTGHARVRGIRSAEERAISRKRRRRGDTDGVGLRRRVPSVRPSFIPLGGRDGN